MLTYPIVFYHILSYPILSYPILSYRILSCLVLPFLVLSCPVLSCPVLSCAVHAHRCHQIPLCHLDGTDAWISTLSKRYRTYVRRSVEMIEVAPASTEAEWLAAHDTLRRNKARKDREMALTPAAMLGTRQAFPDQVRMLVVRVEGDIVAAALTYLVRPGIELLVNWGDREHDLPTSPMPGLMWHMVRRGLDEGVRWLDLGISSEADGTPNHGLAFFKTRFGATTELRLDLTLEL